MPRLCCYVTGHSLGHASRVQAVLEELLRVHPDSSLELRTGRPGAPSRGSTLTLRRVPASRRD